MPHDVRYTPQPRAGKYLIFEGIYEEEVLGVFAIIRGFADLQDLARVSVAYQMSDPSGQTRVEGFQREIDPQHAIEIKKYLEDSDVRFLPEVILSVRSDFMTEVETDTEAQELMSADEEIIIRPRWRGKQVYQVRVKIDALESIRAQRRIRRIDGNHRLERAKDLTEDLSLLRKYHAPFCMILLKPTGDSDDDYTESVIFHDINSKALPLRSEHALKLILGQSDVYGLSSRQEFTYDPAQHLTRRLRDWAQNATQSVRERFANRLVSLNSTARGVLDMNQNLANDFNSFNVFTDELLDALNEISSNLDQSQTALFQTDYFIDLAAYVWMEKAELSRQQRILETVKYLKDMDRWLGGGGLDKLKSSGRLSEQLLEIYKAVQQRIPKRVFLARWYPPTSEGEQYAQAQRRLGAIQGAIDDLYREVNHRLELIDLGTTRGATFPIHQIMYEAVKSSDIILVDLTGLRPNVCIEAGFALKHQAQGKLIFLHHEGCVQGEQVPFDLTMYRYEPFRDTGDIRDRLKARFVEILHESGLNI